MTEFDEKAPELASAPLDSKITKRAIDDRLNFFLLERKFRKLMDAEKQMQLFMCTFDLAYLKSRAIVLTFCMILNTAAASFANNE